MILFVFEEKLQVVSIIYKKVSRKVVIRKGVFRHRDHKFFRYESFYITK